MSEQKIPKIYEKFDPYFRITRVRRNYRLEYLIGGYPVYDNLLVIIEIRYDHNGLKVGEIYINEVHWHSVDSGLSSRYSEKSLEEDAYRMANKIISDKMKSEQIRNYVIEWKDYEKD